MWTAFAVLCLASTAYAESHSQKLETLPGADLLGIGYDAVYGEFRNLPVVDLSTFNEGRTWENPFTKTTYRVPDQAHVHTGTDYSATTKVYHSSKTYAEDRTLDVNVGVHAGPWLTLSTDVQSAHSILSGGDTVLSETRQRIVVFDAAVLPASLATVADKFTETMQHLPQDYDAKQYADFISYYGTHTVMGGSFGGEARLRALATSSYFSEHNDVDIGVQAAIKWQQYSLGANASHTSSSSAAWTKSGSTVDASAIGGNPAIHWTDSYGDWARSVYAAPAEVTLSLFPLHKFAADPTISANILRAVTDYHAAHALSPTTPVSTTTTAKLPFCTPTQLVHGKNRYSCGSPTATTTSITVASINAHSGYQVLSDPGLCCGPAFTIDNVNAS